MLQPAFCLLFTCASGPALEGFSPCRRPGGTPVLTKQRASFSQLGLFLCQKKYCGVRKGCLFLEPCPVTVRPCEGSKTLCLFEQLGYSHFRGLCRPEQMSVRYFYWYFKSQQPHTVSTFSAWVLLRFVGHVILPGETTHLINLKLKAGALEREVLHRKQLPAAGWKS